VKTVLYVNHGLGSHCGVYDFGKRHFNAISLDKNNNYVYLDANSIEEYLSVANEVSPDAVLFNYMQPLMPWLDMRARQVPAKTYVVQHLYDPGSVVHTLNQYGSLFDYMVCLDPSLSVPNDRIFALGRPIPRIDKVKDKPLKGEISIGSFGFGLPHKQFHLIMREINRCFDEAVFNLHMTVGDFTGDYSEVIIDACQAEITKPGIRLNHTSDYLPEDAVVEMLSNNHMNALFYALPPDNAGLSSSIDYMIAAQRPTLVTNCASFKHVYNGTYVYPEVSFDTIAGNYEWCQRASYDMYTRHFGKVIFDTVSMLERTL